ncbi:MAG: ABC transporter permease [Acidobacteriota bacterium]
MENLIRDLRLTLRSLRRQPGFAGVVVLTLALGIGVNVAVLQTIYSLVLRPLPFIDTGSEAKGLLVALGMRHDTLSVEAYDFSPPDVRDFTEQCSACRTVAVHDRRTVVLAASGGGTLEEGAQRISAEAVSPELFSVLDTQAWRGRTLRPGEDEPGGPPVAVISHRLWRQLGAEDDLVGRDLLLDGRATEVVGIMPEGFRFPARSDLWFPIEQRLEDARSQRWIDNVIARLEPGTALATARAETETFSQRLAAAYPASNKGWSFTLMPYRERLVQGPERQMLGLLLGAVLFVLLIACVNVTNLLLARESGRRTTAAIRLALGCDRWNLIRQRMTENAVLATAGGGLGVLLSAWMLDYLKQADPRGWEAWLSLDLGAETIIFTIALTLLSTLAFGLLPSLRAANPSPGSALGEGQRRAIGGEPYRVQRGLVIAQIGLALTLLVGASLMVRSVTQLFYIDAGFDTTNLLTLRVQLSGERYEEPAARPVALKRLLEELEALPGVESAAATSAIPLVEDGTAVPVSYPGQVLRDGESQIATYILQTPGLFDLLDVRLLAGRTFTAAEIADPESRVAIINDELANHLWGERDPVGDRIRLGYQEDAPWTTVIGVVPKIYYEEPGEETDQSRLQIHLPYARVPWATMGVLVRTRVDPESLTATVRRQVAAVDPTLAIDSLYSMTSLRSQVIWAERLLVELFGTFAFLALVLSALGIYGVMAYAVSQSRREIGVRMALGADRSNVRGLFLVRGLLMVAPGVALGLLGAAGTGRLLDNALYGVEAGDPLAFSAALTILIAAAAIGIALPVRRAMRVEPSIALRQE